MTCIKLHREIAFTLILNLVVLNLSFAQTYIQDGPKLVGTGTVGKAWQGGSVAISADGNTFIMGGAYDNGYIGGSWVFVKSGGAWVQQGGKIVGGNFAGTPYQGAAVAISGDGNTALIGGFMDSSGVGAAWVFTRSGGVWTQIGTKLVGSGGVGASMQARGVALSADGNTAVLGGPGDNGGIGATWIFTRGTGIWMQQGPKLVGTGRVGSSSQGEAVSMSGDGNRIIVGGESDNGSTGAAWIFDYVGSSWNQVGSKLVGTGAIGGASQGKSVAISLNGSTVLVGGYTDDGNSGATWAFTDSGGMWVQQGGKIVASGFHNSSRQGVNEALSADGNRAIIGGYLDDGGVGGAWIFDRSAGTWNQIGGKLVGSGAVGLAWQGAGIAITPDRNTVIVAGYNDDNNSGAAWVFKVDSNSAVAQWHFDETSGSSVFDSSSYHNNGTANGTTIIDGILGKARHFDGAADHVYVPDPPNRSLDFGPSESFTVSAWFRTTTTGYPEIVRKGLAPVPGFDMRMANGHLLAELGNRWDGVAPDTVLQIFSDGTVNDGNWHLGTFVRDRGRHKMFLYVDNISAASSIDDNFPYAIINYAPLEIGWWGVRPGVEDFEGDIDEVSIFRSLQHPVAAFQPIIKVSPSVLNFDPTMVGDFATKQLWVTNVGLRETLNVSSIVSTNPSFTPDETSLSIFAGNSQALQVLYAPTSVHSDTGSVIISSNDPQSPQVVISLNGSAFVTSSEPVITNISDIPNDQGNQLRLIWAKSISDDSLSVVHATEYAVWRRVDDPPPSFIPAKYSGHQVIDLGGRRYIYVNDQLWDFITTVPAVHFAKYSYVAPTLFDATNTDIHWSVFEVSVHLSDGSFFFSASDSGYSVDNLSPNAPTQLSIHHLPDALALGWAKIDDPDISHFNVYRTTAPSSPPTSMTLVGTSHTNAYIDALIDPLITYYYRVTSIDKAGNQSGYSAEIGSVILGVDPQAQVPQSFKLYQNYPNPFNPSSKIRFDVPKDGEVTIRIYDILGREIATLSSGKWTAGIHEVVWNAQNIPSGVYLVRMTAENYVSVMKLILAK